MADDPFSAREVIKVSATFPYVGSDGKPFGEEAWKWWRDQMQLFEVYVEMQVFVDCWEEEIEQQRRVYWIVERAQHVIELRQFVLNAKQHFGAIPIRFEFGKTHHELL